MTDALPDAPPPVPIPPWHRTDEWLDVASSLDHLALSLSLVGEKPGEWKWAVLACHSALQGILVCVLSGSDGLGCLDDKSTERVLKWMEESRANPDTKPPRERLAELPILVDRAYDLAWMNEFGGGPIPFDEAVHDLLLKLHELRNDFTHFRPSLWSIQIGGLPDVVQAAMLFGWRILMGHPASTFRMNNERLILFQSRFDAVSRLLIASGRAGLPNMIRVKDHLVRP